MTRQPFHSTAVIVSFAHFTLDQVTQGLETD
jgi:hypothetical protein